LKAAAGISAGGFSFAGNGWGPRNAGALLV